MLSEADVYALMVVEERKNGAYLYRNNVGAGKLQDGSFVRWGLANESSRQNEVLKSADAIGFRPRLITQDMVGSIIAQFVSYEAKAEGWVFKGSARELAQHNWMEHVARHGGDAAFVTCSGLNLIKWRGK